MAWNPKKPPRPNIRVTGRRWRILVEGDERAIAFDWDERKAITYLAGRLLTGEDVAPAALEYYGITVRYLGDGVEIIEVPGG
jgi:hypothetical protein